MGCAGHSLGLVQLGQGWDGQGLGWLWPRPAMGTTVHVLSGHGLRCASQGHGWAWPGLPAMCLAGRVLDWPRAGLAIAWPCLGMGWPW
jgi:hypothetical protein